MINNFKIKIVKNLIAILKINSLNIVKLILIYYDPCSDLNIAIVTSSISIYNIDIIYGFDPSQNQFLLEAG